MSPPQASPPPTSAGREPSSRLPDWLQPRDRESAGSGCRRLIETTLLVLVGLVLTVATVYDLSREVKVNRRLIADEHTWRLYTGHDYHDLSIDQELLGADTEHEVVCGNTRPAAPKATTQLCLVIWGPVIDGRRTVHGGWYLAPHVEDVRADRYGCFGEAPAGACPS